MQGLPEGDHVTDEPIRQSHAHPSDDRGRSSRGMLGLIGIMLVIVIVVLMLLMLQSCDTAANRDAGSGGAKQIVPVTGLSADPSLVSAWVTPDGDISDVLKVAGLEDASITDMGGGRYVISVPLGTEDTVVRILAGVKGVYDAGRVYDLSK